MAGAWPVVASVPAKSAPKGSDIKRRPFFPSPLLGEGRGLSLLLDAAGFDELRPLLFILVDEAGIVFGAAGRDFGAVIAKLLLHLVGSERVAQRLVELVDDRPRRA